MGAQQAKPFNYDEQLMDDKRGPYSTEVKDPETPANCSNPRRFAATADRLVSKIYEEEDGGYGTIYQCFQRGAKKFPNNKCFGTRIFELDADKKNYVIKDKAPSRKEFAWDTYQEIDDAARKFGAGLVSLGAKSGDNVGIFSSNRTEWMISALGFYSQKMRVVSLYSTLGEKAVEYIVNHGDVKIICVSKQNIKNLIKSLPEMKDVTHIIQYDVNEKYQNIAETVADEDVKKASEYNVKVIGFSEVIKMGTGEAAVQPNPATAEDVAYIMYTSGTTGDPKGAILTHQNITAAIACVPYFLTITDSDSYLSYLPLAHIFETVAEVAILVHGGAIGFFQDNIRKLTEDLQELQPTWLCGVPRVFTRMHQVVFDKINNANCAVKWFFNRAYQHQCEKVRAGEKLDEGYDKKIFSALRAKMGLSKVKNIVTGAAPCPPYLLEFLKVVSNANVLQGYGMTEGAAATAIVMPNDPTVGHVGPPVPCVEIRLEDIPDMGYMHTDNPPRGEILIRGPNVFKGYYKNDKETEGCLQKDGWLHTGDVGRFNPNGTLSVIDRKKNMFKLSQGEYIAVEKVEQAYQKSPLVGQIWVYGNSFKSFLLAVVVPAADPLMNYCLEKGWWPSSREEAKLGSDSFCADYKKVVTEHGAEIKEWIKASLKEQEKPLKGFEKIMDFMLESEVDKLGLGFTEANNTLTPTYKMRRPQLLQRYSAPLKEMYAKNGEPVAADERW